MVIPNGIRVSNEDEYSGGRDNRTEGLSILSSIIVKVSPKPDVHLSLTPEQKEPPGRERERTRIGGY